MLTTEIILVTMRLAERNPLELKSPEGWSLVLRHDFRGRWVLCETVLDERIHGITLTDALLDGYLIQHPELVLSEC